MILKKQMESISSTLGQIKGNNRYMRYFGPDVIKTLLKTKMWEIDAFAQDRSLDPYLVFSIAAKSMSAGRVPELALSGLTPDDQRAVTAFIADVFLNMESEEQEGEVVDEATYGGSFGSYIKNYYDTIKRANVKPIGLADVPQEIPVAPDDRIRTGVSMTSSAFRKDIKNPFNMDNVLSGMAQPEKSLQTFRDRARKFRELRNAKD